MESKRQRNGKRDREEMMMVNTVTNKQHFEHDYKICLCVFSYTQWTAV